MKLITSRFLRKQNYFGSFIYAWYFKKYFNRLYRVNYLFSDGTSLLTYQGCLDTFYRRSEVVSVYFDLFTDDLYKSEERFFFDFVKACSSRQLATFLCYVEHHIDNTLCQAHFTDFRDYVYSYVSREQKS